MGGKFGVSYQFLRSAIPPHFDNPTLTLHRITKCCAASEVRFEPKLPNAADCANVGFAPPKGQNFPIKGHSAAGMF